MPGTLHACLVHERPDCVADLVLNLHHLDPDSPILLYDGGRDPALLRDFPWERHGAVVHPSPRPMKWGHLHEFALDCMRWAQQHLPFDTLTVVDSDQLAMRAGHAARNAAFLRERPKVGLVGSAPPPRPGTARPAPVVTAWGEIRPWRPFLRRFPDGEARWAHWTFWPSTVFTADAARDLVRLWDGDAQLRDLMRRSKLWATEEVLLPTLVALLDYEVAETPCHHEWVRYRARWSLAQLDLALADPDAFWIHPVPRRIDDPLRARIRERHGHYGEAPPAPRQAPRPAAAAPPAPPPVQRGGTTRSARGAAAGAIPHSVLAEMRAIEGWLSDDEAALLYASCARALGDPSLPRTLVEVGSLCGKGTVVMGRAAEIADARARVHAVDPLDGKVGTRERLHDLGPTRDRLESALARAGLGARVEIHPAPPTRPSSSPWSTAGTRTRSASTRAAGILSPPTRSARFSARTWSGIEGSSAPRPGSARRRVGGEGLTPGAPRPRPRRDRVVVRGARRRSRPWRHTRSRPLSPFQRRYRDADPHQGLP